MSGVATPRVNDTIPGLTPTNGIGGCLRLDFTDFNIDSAQTDGGLIKAGDSTNRVVEDTAGMKFISCYFDDGATSGEAVGIYDRLYVTGIGGEGIAFRGFCTVENVAAANARGAHVSLSFGTSGGVTGLGTALETTLHIPNQNGMTGTVSSVKAAINADGATSDPAGARLSVINVVNQGNATGMADVDTDAALFDFQGWTAGAGSMIGALDGNEPTWAGKTCLIKCRLPNGTAVYLVSVLV